MFSDNNYGLPKALIDAAKKVHENQLMEYDEDGYIKNPPKGMDKGTEEDRKRAAKMGLKGPHLEGEGRVTKKQLPPLPVRKPKKSQAEEVEFTEEELAEAFAIFLEENFHVDMLTEEDLDFVFEEEFPQWLDMIVERSLDSSNQDRELAKMGLKKDGNSFKPISKSNSGMRDTAKMVMKQQQRKRVATVKAAETGKAKGNARDLPQYLPHRSKIFQGDTEGGNTPAPKATPTPTPPPTPTARTQVSAKPASTARKQVRGPSSTGTKSSVYKPQSRIMKDTGAAAPDFGNNNATFDADNKPVFKSDTETRRAANLRTISKRKRRAPTRRAPTRRAPTRRAPTRRAPTRSWKKTVFEPQN